MPGHTNAALASYAGAELRRRRAAAATPASTVGFSSLCVDKRESPTGSSTTCSRELAALTPGPYLHIGGDEAHATPAEDYATFMERVQPIVAEYGKKVDRLARDRARPRRRAGRIAQYWGTAAPTTPIGRGRRARAPRSCCRRRTRRTST